MSVKSILDNENTKSLIKTFDLETPEPEYKLEIVDYGITPEGVVTIEQVNIMKDGEFYREADLGKLFDHLPNYSLRFIKND